MGEGQRPARREAELGTARDRVEGGDEDGESQSPAKLLGDVDQSGCRAGISGATSANDAEVRLTKEIPIPAPTSTIETTIWA